MPITGRYGQQLIATPTNLRKCKLANKSFNYIIIYFTDENNKRINFQKTQVSLAITDITSIND